MLIDEEDRTKRVDAAHPFPWTCHVMVPDRAHITDDKGGVVVAYVKPDIGMLIVQEANAAATRYGILS